MTSIDAIRTKTLDLAEREIYIALLWGKGAP